MIFVYLPPSGWKELDGEKMIVYNYMGGHHDISAETLSNAKTFECESWHELYLAKGFCPFESDVRCRNAWIAPNGKIYDCSSHDVTAEYLCDIIYGAEPVWAGDDLEAKGCL